MPIMRARAAALAAAMLLPGACTTARPGPDRSQPPASAVTVRLADGRVESIPLETYVRGAILSELSPAGLEAVLAGRAFDVQAVLARTFAVANRGRHRAQGFDLCSTTHCQVYDPRLLARSSRSGSVHEAVARTAGTVVWFGAAPATTLYHADCGGHTSAGEDVWGGTARPYLAAAPDDGPAGGAHRAWRFEVEGQRLAAALNADRRTRVGARLRRISILRRDAGGRAELVVLHGTREPIVRGEELRAVMIRAFGYQALRSTRFDVSLRKETFSFEGRGFGPGVGLCQAGAVARLAAGWSPEEVLAHYYPRTTLARLR